MQKEAKARIKINDLLQKSSWRFFNDENGKANITVENKGANRLISNGPNSERSWMKIFSPAKNTGNSTVYMIRSFIRISDIIKT